MLLPSRRKPTPREQCGAVVFEREVANPMEVKLGVIYSQKELEIETDQSPDEVIKTVEDAMNDDARIFWLVDSKGRRIGIPIDKLAYVEIGEDTTRKGVGFASR
ncbi:MAG TPA: DUF3107 domain-containing protein [Actinomycetes bacterium]|nr:DUF3107 domain-containing protein [Actinomycetes bacterium]